MEDREKVRSSEPDDVEAHKKKTSPVAMGNEEPTAEGETDDVELHRSKSQSQKL